jgi:hypothetical protein
VNTTVPCGSWLASDDNFKGAIAIKLASAELYEPRGCVNTSVPCGSWLASDDNFKGAIAIKLAPTE